MRRLLAVSCLAVTLVVSSAGAQVAPYRFEALAERGDGPAPFGDNGVRKLPALNNSGTVAYITPRAGATATDEILYMGTPGNVSEVATPGVRVVGGVSINNPGRAAFVGYASGGSGGYGVYTVSPGGPVVTIAPAVSYSDRFETAISDGGAVITTSDPAFGMPAWVAGSIIMGDGTSPAQVVFSGRSPHPPTPLQTSQIVRPRMSGSGEWVASESGTLAFGSYTAMHTNRGSSYFDPQILGFGRGAADVANGALLFQGTTFNDRTQKLYISRDGGETVAVPGSEGLAASVVALNDDGVIAVLSGGPELGGTLLRLFRDGVAQTVLAAGDPLLGSTVSTIGFDPKGFNNSEQFALLVGLADGRDVFVLASPVPEPAGLAVLGGVVGLLALRRRGR